MQECNKYGMNSGAGEMGDDGEKIMPHQPQAQFMYLNSATWRLLSPPFALPTLLTCHINKGLIEWRCGRSERNVGL